MIPLKNAIIFLLNQIRKNFINKDKNREFIENAVE